MLDDVREDDLLVEGLSVHIEKETGAAPRLLGVDLRVRRGEWLAVVGVNGSGKSTLARVLAGLPLDGATGTMRRGFAGPMPAAFVMQQPDAQLFGDTPREELAFALEWLGTPAGEVEERAARALERAGLLELADEPWHRLSGGQRQLAAAAAATAGEPPLVVFDEATSMLGEAAASRVLAMARELQERGAAIVWVTQRLEEIAPGMRVVAMQEGRIAFEGPGREFLYGREPLREEPPCVRCGLRLPYMAALALELARHGRMAAPLPMTPAEWQAALGGEATVAAGAVALSGRAAAVEAGRMRRDADAAADGVAVGGRFGGEDANRGTAYGWHDEGAAGRYAAGEWRGENDTGRLVADLHSGKLVIRGDSGEAAELVLRRGELTVLLGANGAGKTSLLEIVAGLRDPEGLAIRFGETPLWLERNEGGSVPTASAPRDWRVQTPDVGSDRAESRENRRRNNGLRPRGRRKLNAVALRRYAYASQSPEQLLVRRTAEEELREVLKPYRLSAEEQTTRIAAALRAVGWDEGWLDRDPYRMSGGERRRLALACLFAVPAEWLLVDEPTAGLDAAGQRLIGSELIRLRDEGAGAVIVSHDSEWALPLADRVLLLSADGSIRDCRREELALHPEWWEEAGLEAPAWLTAATALAVEASRDGPALNAIWQPAELANACTPSAAAKREKPDAAEEAERQLAAASMASATPSRRIERLRPRTDRGRRVARTALEAFDPRAAWLSYVLLSLAIFSRHTWMGLAAAGMATLGAVLLGRIPLRRWRRPIAAYALFALLVSLIAGIRFGGEYSAHAFSLALQSLSRTFLVMLLGFGLALTITPLRLRRSLEQTLSWRGRQPFRVQQLILLVTLMLRFVPMFVGEWERFSRYAIARNKEASLKLRTAAKRLTGTAMPFLLSLFRLGDQAADALESRGVGRRRQPTLRRTLRWRMRDSVLILGVVAVSLLLWWLK